MKDEKIKEIVYMAVQATKSENSGLIADIRKSIAILETHHLEVKDTLERIEEQTKKTNGRVSRLENWRSYITGGLAVVGIVIALVIYIFNSSMQTVQAELKRNEISIEKLK